MNLGMFGQVVTAGKLLLAERTLVGLDARVRAAVAGQLVRAREPWRTRQEHEDEISQQRQRGLKPITCVVEEHTSTEPQCLVAS